MASDLAQSAHLIEATNAKALPVRRGMPLSRATLVSFACLALALTGLLGRLLGYPLQHDEQIHVSAGVLVSDFRLYQDLGYNHLPNLPLLLNALYSITGTQHYLLAGRILAYCWWLGACGALGLIVYHFTRKALVTNILLLLFVSNVLFLGQAGLLVANSVVPIPFALLGLYFFLRASDGNAPQPLMSALSGFCIAIAIGFKVNYIFLVPPFAFAVLFAPHEWPISQRLGKNLLPMLAGGVIGGLPTLLYLAANPQSFLAHTMRYFTIAHKAYWLDLDAPRLMSVTDKILLAEDVWFSGANLLAACAAAAMAFLVLLSAGSTREGWQRLWHWPVLLTIGLILSGMMVSFVPTPSFAQYFTPPIVFVIVLAAQLYGLVDPVERKAALPLFAGIAVLVLAAAASRLLPGITMLATPGKWTGIVVHEQANRMAAAMSVTDKHQKVATLSPIYPLEAGLSIYPEFAAGPFLYRVADYIPAGDRPYFRTTAPAQLAEFLDHDPPAGIIIGPEGELDSNFKAYAQRHGYSEVVPAKNSPLRLFVRPK